MQADCWHNINDIASQEADARRSWGGNWVVEKTRVARSDAGTHLPIQSYQIFITLYLFGTTAVIRHFRHSTSSPTSTLASPIPRWKTGLCILTAVELFYEHCDKYMKTSRLTFENMRTKAARGTCTDHPFNSTPWLTSALAPPLHSVALQSLSTTPPLLGRR